MGAGDYLSYLDGVDGMSLWCGPLLHKNVVHPSSCPTGEQPEVARDEDLGRRKKRTDLDGSVNQGSERSAEGSLG